MCADGAHVRRRCERRWTPSWPIDLATTLGCSRTVAATRRSGSARRRSGGRPRTPQGPVTVHYARSGAQVLARAWGPGRRARARPTAPGAGRRGRPGGVRGGGPPGHGRGVPALRARVARAAHRPGPRGARAGRAGAARHREWRPSGRGPTWCRAFGEPAPGPPGRPGSAVPPLVAPDGPGWARIPSWAWHRAGVDPGRARTITRPPRARPPWRRLSGALARGGRQPWQSLPGIGVWTAAEVGVRAWGDRRCGVVRRLPPGPGRRVRPDRAHRRRRRARWPRCCAVGRPARAGRPPRCGCTSGTRVARRRRHRRGTRSPTTAAGPPGSVRPAAEPARARALQPAQRSEENRTAVSPRATPGHTRAPGISSLPGPMIARSPTTTPSSEAPAPITAPGADDAVAHDGAGCDDRARRTAPSPTPRRAARRWPPSPTTVPRPACALRDTSAAGHDEELPRGTRAPPGTGRSARARGPPSPGRTPAGCPGPASSPSSTTPCSRRALGQQVGEGLALDRDRPAGGDLVDHASGGTRSSRR